MQPATDGRVQRGERNRAAIVDALLSLLEDGVLRPSARQVAERAGVSLRAVFQHFDDMESLYAEWVRRQWHLAGPIYGIIIYLVMYWVVVPTRFGVYRREETGPASNLVRVKDLEGLYLQLRECAIDNNGTKIACVRENKVVIVDATGATGSEE